MLTFVTDLLIREPEDVYVAWMLAFMVPYRDAPQAEAEPGKKQPPPTAAIIAREGIKATNKVCDVITASIRNRIEIAELVHVQSDRRRTQQQRGDRPVARDVLGMSIRRWGASWRSQLMFAMLADVADDPQATDSKTATEAG